MTHTADDMHDDAPMTTTAGISAEAVAGLVRDLGLAEDLLAGDYAYNHAKTCKSAADALTTLAAEVEALRRERDTCVEAANMAAKIANNNSARADSLAAELAQCREAHKAEVEAIIADAAMYCWHRYKDRPPANFKSPCVFTSHEHQKIEEALRGEMAKRARSALKGTSHERDA